jgi:hypothetical protein
LRISPAAYFLKILGKPFTACVHSSLTLSQRHRNTAL